ncbi:MAG: ATP-binding protein [Pseudomonadota bacterium]
MNVHSGPVNQTMAPITNVALMTDLVGRVTTRAPGLPGLGVFYGPSGYGKSTAAAYAAIKYRAVVVEIRSAYTAKYLCAAIAAEFGLEEKGSTAALVDRIAAAMARTGRPLIIDEADYLVGKRLIEIVRDLHEASQGSIILIGEERFPVNIEKWERFHGRVLSFTAAEPVSLDDVRHLAGIYCPGVSLTDDLVQLILDQSGRSARRVATSLNRVRERAAVLGLEAAAADAFEAGEFSDGSAPKPRRLR